MLLIAVIWTDHARLNEFVHFTLGVDHAAGVGAVLAIEVGSGRYQLCDDNDAGEQHNDRDHHFNEGEASLSSPALDLFPHVYSC